jgi:hypothetical protein
MGEKKVAEHSNKAKQKSNGNKASICFGTN